MRKFEPTLEHAIYALALVIAAGFRFIRLGVIPLSNFEADLALQALHITQGLRPVVGPNTAYVHLTAILFWVFSSTTFLARFLPALVGTALVLVPWALRRRIGRIAALVLVFGLAIDPGLVAASRLAGGPMLAIGFGVFAGLAWTKGRSALTGMLVALALLSGASIWFGLLSVALTWALLSAFVKLPAASETDADLSIPAQMPDLRRALAWGIGTVLLVGSLLIFSPQGLSGFVVSLWVFLKGWVTLPTVPLWQPALALPAYELLPLGFGIAGAVRGIIKRDANAIMLGMWALVAVILVIIYSGRQVVDLAWALLPLWTLAAMELSHHFDFAGQNLWEVAGTMTVIVVLLVFGWLNVAALTGLDLASPLTHTRLWLLLAVFFMIILSLLLAGTGWSASVARLGGVWGGVVCLALFTIAMSTGSAGIREPRTAELWEPQPRTGRADILLKVATEISTLNRTDTAQLPVSVLANDSAALHWLFRSWSLTDVAELTPDATPEMIITPPGNVSLSAAYRGEPLVLTETVQWDQANTAQWLEWFVYRQMPVVREDVDLWVRSDLRLEDQAAPSTNP
jgi:hypothetical protein